MDLPVTSMTTAQKLKAMEQLWASLRAAEDFSPPQWHGAILSQRQKQIDRGETVFSTVDQVRERLMNRGK